MKKQKNRKPEKEPFFRVLGALTKIHSFVVRERESRKKIMVKSGTKRYSSMNDAYIHGMDTGGYYMINIVHDRLLRILKDT